jgi:polar amino acid transport system substrate-binding protein
LAADAETPDEIDAVTGELPPYYYTANGKVTGYATEVVEASLREAGMRGNFTSLPWTRALRQAQLGENVLIYALARNEEREALYKWVGQITVSRTIIYGLAGKPLQIDSLADAKRYVVGTMLGDIRESYLLKAGFIKGVNLETVTSDEANYQKLKAGRIEPLLRLDDVGGKYNGGFMAFGTRTSDALVERLRRGLAAAEADGSIAAITAKWLK